MFPSFSSLLKFLALALMMFAGAGACTAQAQGREGGARDLAMTSGPALGLGFGNETAGLGGVLHYYFQISDSRWRVALHAGVGAQWLGSNASDSRFRPAASGGVTTTFGRRQRLLIGLWGGPSSRYQALSLHGESYPDWRPLYGMGLNVGWEGITRRGFIVRSSLGPAYAFYPRIYREVGAWGFSGNLLTLGYKLW